MVGFFGALGNMIVATDEQPPEKRNLAVAAFIRSMGKLAQEGVKADGKTEMGAPLERFFDSLSEIVEVGENEPDSQKAREAVGKLIQSLSGFVQADPDNNMPKEQRAALEKMLASIRDIVVLSKEEDPAHNRKLVQELLDAIAEIVDSELKVNLELDTPAGTVRVKDSKVEKEDPI